MASLELVCVLSGHTDRVWNVCWHPTCQLLATCGGDRTIRLWAPRFPSSSRTPWICIEVIDDFTTRTVRSCAWSPCGNFLAAGSFDAKAYVYRIKLADGDLTSSGSVSVLPVATLDGHENEVKSVAWSPSGTLLATSSRDKSVWIWEVLDGGRDVDMVACLTGHEQDVKAVAWHPSREILASASYDDTIKVWGEAEDDWTSICTLSGPHISTVWDLAWEPVKGSRCASVSEDGSLQMWRASPAQPGSTTVPDAVVLTHEGGVPAAHSRTVYSVSWAEDPLSHSDTSGDVHVLDSYVAPCRLATAGADDCIRVWVDNEAFVQGGTEPPVRMALSVSGAHAGDVNCVRWQPPRLSRGWCGQGEGANSASKRCKIEMVLASAGDDCLVKLWRYSE